MKLSNDAKKRWKLYALLTLCMVGAYAIIFMFTNKTLFMHTSYDSYALQAARWLEGHLDLGMDYPHLELAIYEGKYFVSFPPLPTLFVLPFVILFGVEGTPEYFITTVLSIIGAIYVLKIFLLYCKKEMTALLWTLLTTIGSNFLLIGYNGDIWLFAQTAAFMFTSMSFYYALTDSEKDGKWPLFYLACAVGCRPLNMLYLPVIAYLLIKKFKKHGLTFWGAIRKHYTWLIAPAVVGIFYMVLNVLRFDNPFQFGHDWLPVNTRDPNETQFGLKYFEENFKNKLFRLPEEGADHRILFPKAGFAFYLTSPIYALGFLYFIKSLFGNIKKKCAPISIPVLLIGILVSAHLLVLCLHSSMAGIQWGLRYTIDAIPAVAVGIAMLLPKEKEDALDILLLPVLVFGLCLNTVGTLAILNNWSIFL